MKLYRAGEPTRGKAYWSATPDQARKVGGDLAIHEAELLPSARVHRAEPGTPRSPSALRKLKHLADVIVFPAKDGTYEYVVLNPHILKILQ